MSSRLKKTYIEKNTNSEYNKSFNAISRIFLSSFVIISFFYITPIFINFADKNFNNNKPDHCSIHEIVKDKLTIHPNLD